jgi:hypothetical protein
VSYELIDPSGLTKEQESARQKELAEPITQDCLKADAVGEGEANRAIEVRPGMDRLSALDALDDLSRRHWMLDREMDTCLRRYGATGYPIVTTVDGVHYRRAEYVDAAGSAMKREASRRDSEAAFTSWIGGLGAGLVSVRGHVQRDGTVGYLRTCEQDLTGHASIT